MKIISGDKKYFKWNLRNARADSADLHHRNKSGLLTRESKVIIF